MLILFLVGFFQTYFTNLFVYSANPESLNPSTNHLNFNQLLEFAGIRSAAADFSSNNDLSYTYKNDSQLPVENNSRNLKKPKICSIFSSKCVDKKKEVFNSYIEDFKRILDSNFSTSNINSCLNMIFNNKGFIYQEKRKLLETLQFFIKENMKTNHVKIDVFEIIKNTISNDNHSFRIEKFLRDLFGLRGVNCEKRAQIIQDIIEADKFDSVHFGIMLFVLENSFFDLLTVIRWLDFSIVKIKENKVKDVDKLKEFLETILDKINLTKDSFTAKKLELLIIKDLEFFNMNINLKTIFFFDQNLKHKDLTEWIKTNLVEILFSTCLNFDTNFECTKFLEKYFFFMTKSYITKINEKNSIWRKNNFFTEFLQLKRKEWRLSRSTVGMMKGFKLEDIKKHLMLNLYSFSKFNYPTIKNIFEYCVGNNLIAIAAQIVEKLCFIGSFGTLDKRIIEEIFEIRNCRGSKNPIDENSLFFLINFKYLKNEHLKCYEIDRIIKVFQNFRFRSNNFGYEIEKLIVNTILNKSPNPSYLSHYIKYNYEGSLENIICIMLEVYLEKNSKEKDMSIYENNLLDLSCIIAALPISDHTKLQFLNSFDFDSEKVLLFGEKLKNILSHEEALKQLISILYV